VHSGNYFNYSAGRKTALQSPADSAVLLPPTIKNYFRSDYQPTAVSLRSNEA